MGVCSPVAATGGWVVITMNNLGQFISQLLTGFGSAC